MQQQKTLSLALTSAVVRHGVGAGAQSTDAIRPFQACSETLVDLKHRISDTRWLNRSSLKMSQGVQFAACRHSPNTGQQHTMA
jgi:hypothetical protein